MSQDCDVGIAAFSLFAIGLMEESPIDTERGDHYAHRCFSPAACRRGICGRHGWLQCRRHQLRHREHCEHGEHCEHRKHREYREYRAGGPGQPLGFTRPQHAATGRGRGDSCRAVRTLVAGMQLLVSEPAIVLRQPETVVVVDREGEDQRHRRRHIGRPGPGESDREDLHQRKWLFQQRRPVGRDADPIGDVQAGLRQRVERRRPRRCRASR